MNETKQPDKLLEAINNVSREIVLNAAACDIKQHHLVAAIEKYDKTPMKSFSVQQKIVGDLINNADKSLLENLAGNMPEGISEDTRKFVSDKIEERLSSKQPQQMAR